MSLQASSPMPLTQHFSKAPQQIKQKRNVSPATSTSGLNAAPDAVREDPHVFSHQLLTDRARYASGSNPPVAMSIRMSPCTNKQHCPANDLSTTHTRCSNPGITTSGHYTRFRCRGCHSLPSRWCGQWLRTSFWSYLITFLAAWAIHRPGGRQGEPHTYHSAQRRSAFFSGRQQSGTTRIAGPPAFAHASNAHGLSGHANHNGDHVLTL